MITNEEITNKDVLEFFADKGTGELIKECRPQGAYKKLAKTFMSISNEEEEKKEDKEFYEWLKEQEKQNFSKTLSLAKVAAKDESFKDFILNPDSDNPLIEKWHLYVSWYALEEYWGEKEIEEVSWKKTSVKEQWLTDKIDEPATTDDSGILKKVSCRRLLLWMYEASLSDEDKKHKADIEEKLKREKELKEELNQLREGLIKDMKDKIAENIAKYKKEQ